jgi:YaiO family outer membrane protein
MQNKILLKTCSLLIFILLIGISGKLYAQTFDEARKLAFDGDREKARQMCRQILSTGFNSDVALLMARTYAWDSKYDSTRIVLNEILLHNPNSTEALDAYADVEYWSGNYEKAIEYCDMALKRDSTDEDFLFKKAKIQHSSERFEEAVSTLEQLIRINGANGEAMKKLQEFRFDVMKNRIRINYTIDQFDDAFNRDPWQIVALSYGRKTKLGSVIARVNMAKRFGDTGFQYEMDAYPKISENNYGYVNYGFSQSSVFPDHRIGLEWYHNFPKAYEGSIGMRTLFFSSSDVTIYTATIGKYIGNYWLSLRSFVTPGSDGTSVSGYLLVRRYFSDPENYFGLRLGYGVSPDENQNLIDENLKSRLNLKSMSVKLEFNHIINRVWIVNPSAGWTSEELPTGTTPNYYTFDISITRLF